MSHNFPDQDLDLSFLFDIADGSNEFIIESIDMFLVQTPELIENINAAIETKNWPVAASGAHKLKSNLGFFGMPASQATMQEVEIMAKTGTPDTHLLISKFNEVKETIATNIISLTKVKAELEG
jgi:HPt (histidine-containing phosphotransfer) domain-containing protein